MAPCVGQFDIVYSSMINQPKASLLRGIDCQSFY